MFDLNIFGQKKLQHSDKMREKCKRKKTNLHKISTRKFFFLFLILKILEILFIPKAFFLNKCRFSEIKKQVFRSLNYVISIMLSNGGQI